MTDLIKQDNSDSEYFANVQTLKNEWDGRQVDWLLQWFGAFVNDTNMKIGVTLTVGGNMITGTLIPHQAYFERLAKDISAPFSVSGPEAQEAMHARVLSFHTEQDDDAIQSPVQYIHLDNARVHAGGNQILPDKGTLWRGKISAVEGFIIGEISSVK